MELTGSRKFAAPPQKVWDALHNGAVLKACIPGAEDVAWQGDSAIAFRGSVPVINRSVGVEAQVAEQTAPSHMKVVVNKAGNSGTVTIDLAPDGAGTQLTYNANAQLTGAAAMMDNFATRPMVDGAINKFFTTLESQIQ
jgi:hypothetical protein